MSKSSSKIENSIQELEIFIENCKPSLLSSNKIIVNRDEIEYIIEDIKKNIPEEVERFRKLLSNKEAIEREAQEKYDALIQEATERTNELVSENEIMMQARQKGDEIVNAAVEQAQEIINDAIMQGDAYKDSAQQYLNDMLENLNDLIYSCIDQSTKNTNKFIESLGKIGAVVSENLNELNGVNDMPEDNDEPTELNLEDEEKPSIFDNPVETQL